MQKHIDHVFNSLYTCDLNDLFWPQGSPISYSTTYYALANQSWRQFFAPLHALYIFQEGDLNIPRGTARVVVQKGDVPPHTWSAEAKTIILTMKQI